VNLSFVHETLAQRVLFGHGQGAEHLASEVQRLQGRRVMLIASERELSWLDQSQLRDLSWDGRKILMQESGQGGGDHGTIFLRDTDGSAAVRLGEGEALGLSPDGKWALSLDDRRLVILPTGPGQPRSVAVGDLDVESAAWVPPDAGRLLLNASAPGHRGR